METMSVLLFGAFGSFWNLISWALFGLIAGALAKWIMPGKDPGGCFVTTLIGIGGALLGGWLSSVLFGYEVQGNWKFEGFISAIIGGLIILYLWKKVFKPKN